MADIEVWRVDLSDASQINALWPLLDSEEQVRAKRFHFDHDRRRFVLAHGALRTILGRFRQCLAADLCFVRSTHGKPALMPPHALEFNLSHSADLALCAVAATGELGVDVECHRSVDSAALAQRFFSSSEAGRLAQLDGSALQAAFFACWTRKEAYIKAKGLGLSLPLDQFTVSTEPDVPPRLESSCFAPADVAAYRFWSIPVPAGYSAALAYCGPCAGPPRVRDWHPGE